MKHDTTEARRLADELAADVASLLREGLPQEAIRADAAQSAIRALADTIDSLRAEVAVLQMACGRWERALEHGADRIRIAENERDSLRAQVEALRADAERWQALRHVFHVDEHIGKKTGMPATKLKTHWAGWVAGTHYSAESWADAYIEEAASRSQEAAG